jgi:voltage-gated potassium channel
MRRRLSARLLNSPMIRRIRFYARRLGGQLDRRFFITLVEGILIIVAIAAVLITLFEKDWTLASLGASFYWGLTTVLGQGDSAFITSPAGWLISWMLILFGVALFGTITGALIAIVIDFLLKEGQGMGASGYEGHVVVCGWNTTARDLIKELQTDDYKVKIVVIAPLDKNPAGDGVYFVRGDPTEPADLERAGLAQASAALIFPTDDTNDADMRSILTVMAIESIAPEVRTVAEVNNPRHADHFRRAHVDELLVSSQVGARLLARSALYPGLTELVADIVSGGEGSELYRIAIPDAYLGLSVDEVSAQLRTDHRATLLSISRAGRAYVNPPADFRIASGDDAVVVAESLGTLAPLIIRHEDGSGGPTNALAGHVEANDSEGHPSTPVDPASAASAVPPDIAAVEPAGPSATGTAPAVAPPVPAAASVVSPAAQAVAIASVAPVAVAEPRSSIPPVAMTVPAPRPRLEARPVPLVAQRIGPLPKLVARPVSPIARPAPASAAAGSPSEPATESTSASPTDAVPFLPAAADTGNGKHGKKHRHG